MELSLITKEILESGSVQSLYPSGRTEKTITSILEKHIGQLLKELEEAKKAENSAFSTIQEISDAIYGKGWGGGKFQVEIIGQAERLRQEWEKWASMERMRMQRVTSIYLYNAGYSAGHNATVEGSFVDVYQEEMETYHEDIVSEILNERYEETDQEPFEVLRDRARIDHLEATGHCLMCMVCDGREYWTPDIGTQEPHEFPTAREALDWSIANQNNPMKRPK